MTCVVCDYPIPADKSVCWLLACQERYRDYGQPLELIGKWAAPPPGADKKAAA